MTIYSIGLTIPGEVPAKKNRYRVAQSRMYLHDDVTQWVKDYYPLIRTQLRKISGWKGFETKYLLLEVTFKVVHDKDLDNMLNGLLDALQSWGVIKNDAHVREILARKVTVEKDPVCVLTLSEER